MKAFIALLLLTSLCARADEASVSIACGVKPPIKGTKLMVVIENGMVTSLSAGGASPSETVALPEREQSCEAHPIDPSRLLKVECLSAAGVERIPGVAYVKVELNQITLATSHGLALKSGDRSCMVLLQEGCAP